MKKILILFLICVQSFAVCTDDVDVLYNGEQLLPSIPRSGDRNSLEKCGDDFAANAFIFCKSELGFASRAELEGKVARDERCEETMHILASMRYYAATREMINDLNSKRVPTNSLSPIQSRRLKMKLQRELQHISVANELVNKLLYTSIDTLDVITKRLEMD